MYINTFVYIYTDTHTQTDRERWQMSISARHKERSTESEVTKVTFDTQLRREIKRKFLRGICTYVCVMGQKPRKHNNITMKGNSREGKKKYHEIKAYLKKGGSKLGY